jgi:hypothetical protein
MKNRLGLALFENPRAAYYVNRDIQVILMDFLRRRHPPEKSWYSQGLGILYLPRLQNRCDGICEVLADDSQRNKA